MNTPAPLKYFRVQNRDTWPKKYAKNWVAHWVI